jgi:hypothetical protein
MYQSICKADHSGVWALAWAQVVIFIAMACQVAEHQSCPVRHRFCLAKGFMPQGSGGAMRWLGAGFRSFEYDSKTKLCRTLRGLKQYC